VILSSPAQDFPGWLLAGWVVSLVLAVRIVSLWLGWAGRFEVVEVVVVDPVSVGAAVAVLAGTKVVEKVGTEVGGAGWGLANQILGRVRDWFSSTDDEAAAALARVEEAASPPEGEIDALAALIAERLGAAPKVAGELAPLIEAALADGTLGPVLADQASEVAERSVSITQTAHGDGNVQIGTAGRDVNVDVPNQAR
jgi:hypothetical protein